MKAQGADNNLDGEVRERKSFKSELTFDKDRDFQGF